MAKVTKTANRTTTITDKMANAINDAEKQVAQTAIINSLLGTNGTDVFNGGDDSLNGYWIKYSEYWDMKLYGTITKGVVSLPWRTTESIVTVVEVEGAPVSHLYYVQDSKQVDLTELIGKKVIIMLNFVRNVKENV